MWNSEIERGSGRRERLDYIVSGDFRYNLWISVWVRWFVVIGWLAQAHYRLDLSSETYISTVPFAVSLIVLNGYVHHLMRTKRKVTWHWALSLSALDAIAVTMGILVADGFTNNFFVLYYPAIATFAVVFTSIRVSIVGVTCVAVVYALVSFTVEPGVDLEMKEEKVLFIRIVAMYAVAIAVNLITRLERIRRIEAVDRERALLKERIDLSQTIHDTLAQSTYMIGIGIETAIEFAEKRDNDLVGKLKATHSLTKSTMWDLRYPIEIGPIFEGRELTRVLRSHAAAFSTITSISTEYSQTGNEPHLDTDRKHLLFSIVHNAMTNAHRHANASKVNVHVHFETDSIRLSISDDGDGLPIEYEQRGHGLMGMKKAAERMGGTLEIATVASGRGTVVTCSAPLDTPVGGE